MRIGVRLRRDRRHALGIVAMVAAAAVAACGPDQGTAPEIGDGEWSAVPTDASLRLLVADPFGGPGAVRQVVRSAENWASLWDEWQATRQPSGA